MSHYDDIRNRIHRQMVPLPVLYRDDFSIDHAGLAKYVAWHLENDTRNFCLTFTYSQLDFVTPDEIVEVTRTVMEVVRDDAVFISCTGGGPLREAIRSVQAFEKAGAHAAFVHLPEHCLQNPSHCGELYVEYIRAVAKETEIPLLAVALAVPWSAPFETMLPVQRFEELCEEEQFIGIKDDIYILENRMELVRKFQDAWVSPGAASSPTTSSSTTIPTRVNFPGFTIPNAVSACSSCSMRTTTWR